MEEFLGRMAEDREVTIESAADFRVQLPRDADIGLTSQTVQWLLGEMASRPFFSYSQDGARFYGSLSNIQRSDAKSGGLTTTYGELSQFQQAILRDLVFEGYAYIQDTQPSQRQNRATYWFNLERTEVLPKGIPADAVISVEDKENPVAFVSVSANGQQPYTYAQPAEQIGWLVHQARNPNAGPKDYKQEVVGWNLGKQRSVKISIKVGGRYLIEDVLNEDHPAAGPGMTLDQFLSKLPVDVRNKLEQQVAQYAGASEGASGVQQGSAPPR
jgi:hypothetical protein